MFEEDVAARKKLVELLVGEPNIRLATINAVLREVVTKSGLEKLREELRSEISKLEQRIDRLEKSYKAERAYRHGVQVYASFQRTNTSSSNRCIIENDANTIA